MRKLDSIFCPSQASTAICLSMEPNSKNTAQMAGSSSPAIDRYNPIIRDSRRCGNPVAPPTAGTSTSTSTSSRRHRKKNLKLQISPKENHVSINIDREMKNSTSTSTSTRTGTGTSTRKSSSWSCTKPGDFISPPGSSRYLLSGKELLNAISDFDQLPQTQTQAQALAQTCNSKDNIENNDINKILCDEKPVASCISPSPDQVVVLRVSLHCRGCEKKMRKHISRMEGVRSFNIDFAAKKVTVSGKVTALEVLSSISKVKNAQLWPPTISSQFKPSASAKSAAEAGAFVGAVAS